MKNYRVIDISVPLSQSLPPHPSVGPEEYLTRAIELMVRYNRSTILVIHKNRAIGMVELKQALTKMGLRDPTGYQG
jgi:predicted transcriptional regulator